MPRWRFRAQIHFAEREDRALILALDTSTAACTAALLAPDGRIVEQRDNLIGRGHAEHLAPMLDEMLGNHVPSRIIAGIGPGSFTGIRIGLAAAQGMAIGWNVPLAGLDSLALIAAGAPEGEGDIAVAIAGGHGELFVQRFSRLPLTPIGEVASLTPEAAARAIDSPLVVGSGAAAVVEARGHGVALDLLPSAANALKLGEELRTLYPRPRYARPPDARPSEAA